MSLYKQYIKRLMAVLLTIFIGSFIYAYIYSIYYPIPLTSRISLDAKLKFIRDLPDRDNIDTIILGSSIGLNNINGPILEQKSKKIVRLLNMSAFSMEVSHFDTIVTLLSQFPHLKRVIYSAQSLDFTLGSSFSTPDMPLLTEYINLGKEKSSLKYALICFKDFVNIIKRQWTWKEKHLTHNAFENLDYDYTGSAGLHIYGKDIIPRRWNNPFVMPTRTKSYEALKHIITYLQERKVKFYFVAEPYRLPLVKKDKHLRKILATFHAKAKETVEVNKGTFINLHNKLHLDDKYFADRIHLNDTGNGIIANELAHWIDTHETPKGEKHE